MASSLSSVDDAADNSDSFCWFSDQVSNFDAPLDKKILRKMYESCIKMMDEKFIFVTSTAVQGASQNGQDLDNLGLWISNESQIRPTVVMAENVRTSSGLLKIWKTFALHEIIVFYFSACFVFELIWLGEF